ncbi:hypothetical protein [Neobacillus ginsengisoli]|uniref:ArsR family metal-binding transcriptional regulator n=1 Tax=Neobacillus ginsengisoli TaxID=904295 RepID=A0ABT9Y349_9BACI|nr:hypothetical protein [Neobacillus ginsengisoli]MDQ0202232.1 ArsR family metal-binding transcriptional regulator [Neobacillus ginsengisoli]
MDKICCLAYLLHQSDDKKVKNIAIKLLNGHVSLKDIKKIKELKTYITATEAKLKKVDTHKVAQFVEKFMLMEV